jgi:hypothetical protein
MPGVAVPQSDDPLRWADWLEISAAINADGNSSRADLEGCLRMGPFFDSAGQEGVTRRSLEVFLELNERAKAAGDAYPFSVEENIVQLRSSIDRFPAYFFCLCLSYCGWKQTKSGSVFPARMFEDLSCMAAESFTGGEVVRFAYPRKGKNLDLSKAFKAAVQDLTAKLLEGDGCRNKHPRDIKDDGLDVIAWRHFPDMLPGKLVLVGQCAAGGNWTKKLNDLQSQATTNEWLVSPVISQMIKAIFIPHRVPQIEWESVSRRAGIVFDRCRLAYWSHRQEHFGKMVPYLTWSKARVQTVIIQ